MRWTHRHLSDEELILSMDGELPSRRLVRAQRHLTACAACAARLDDLERSLTDATRLARNEAVPPMTTQDEARARLRARMAGSRKAQGSPSRIRDGWVVTGLSAAAIAIAAGLVVWPALRTMVMATTEADGVFLRPRADLTPGATLPLTPGALCGPTREGTARPVAVAVQQEVFARYGADFTRAAEYELDHLITPELGGASDARNLWPQPFGRTPWNAYVKDELELFFHQQVCDGTLDLATAQREIAGDWIAAYKRYFDTDVPLRDYTRSPLTPLDSDMLRSELRELGVVPPPHADGRVLMVMLRQHEGARPIGLR